MPEVAIIPECPARRQCHPPSTQGTFGEGAVWGRMNRGKVTMGLQLGLGTTALSFVPSYTVTD